MLFYAYWMRYRLTNSQFFSEKISSFLKGREISKEINQGLYKAGPEFSFEAPMTFKEGWNFAEFCPVFSSFSLLNFWITQFFQFFYWITWEVTYNLEKTGKESFFMHCILTVAIIYMFMFNLNCKKIYLLAGLWVN